MIAPHINTLLILESLISLIIANVLLMTPEEYLATLPKEKGRGAKRLFLKAMQCTCEGRIELLQKSEIEIDIN